ncbi:MAG: UDP-3-O-(3-hydroxymyristoyl)glucosamine N-acyltransferase [Planctomycetota bacterium]|nr:UDP-3-O-(3-hydroxymyristoyl)glucosamine N-acyltransferase [Planctomycetota bacterium]
MITRTANEIAELCGATVEGDGSVTLVGPAPLKGARRNQVSFLGNERYRSDLETTRAGAVLLAREVEVARNDIALLRCDNPSVSFTRVIEAFVGPEDAPVAGVHESAVVDPEASLGEGVSIGPNCTVGANARLADGVVLVGNVFVGPGVVVGRGTRIHAGVVIYAGVEIGERCTVLGGAVIGSDGFGFEPIGSGWEKIPQCGNVVIEDDVEIGANCTIDRGRFDATRIGQGAKLDNLVHVGHNVEVGASTLLIAQVGISGSTKIGKGAIFAGQSGSAGHVKIGDGARIAARAGVTKDLPGGQDYYGYPAWPRREALRVLGLTRRLPELVRRLEELEERLRALEVSEEDDGS